jgi:ferredoxin
MVVTSSGDETIDHHQERAIVSVDLSVCQGHGRCYSLHPDLFQPDEEGYSIVQGDGTTSLPIAEHARALCPEAAITVLEIATMF